MNTLYYVFQSRKDLHEYLLKKVTWNTNYTLI